MQSRNLELSPLLTTFPATRPAHLHNINPGAHSNPKSQSQDPQLSQICHRAKAFCSSSVSYHFTNELQVNLSVDLLELEVIVIHLEGWQIDQSILCLALLAYHS